MQKQVCRDFAKKQGWVVVKEFSEKGISGYKVMEIIHMQGIGGGITGTLMDGIVQNELSVGTDLGIISGFELSVPHVVLFHAHESSVIVCL